MSITKLLLKIKPIKYYVKGWQIIEDPHYIDVQKKNAKEIIKSPTRTEVLNYLLQLSQKETSYLEIGVRDPESNFNHINADIKYSVDPGVEFAENPVDFKLTSDEFFSKLSSDDILSKDIKFDVIFIDGLHLAPQVDKDITNAFKFIKEDGFIVLHDCNPITEWHAREFYDYHHTPAQGGWNGTTWKAFLKWRYNPIVYSCCIDSDWGIGILSKNYQIGKSIELTNPYFEYRILDANRKAHLNLISFDTLKELTKKQ